MLRSYNSNNNNNNNVIIIILMIIFQYIIITLYRCARIWETVAEAEYLVEEVDINTLDGA